MARTDEFQALGHEIAMQVAATEALAVSRDDLDADRIAAEREIYRAQALQSGNDVMFSYAMQPCVRKAGRDTVLQLFDMPLSFHAQSNTGALTRSMERGIRAVTAVLSRIVLHLLPQAFELIIVAVIIGVRGGIDMAVVAVATVAAYAGFTIATVNTRTKVLQS